MPVESGDVDQAVHQSERPHSTPVNGSQIFLLKLGQWRHSDRVQQHLAKSGRMVEWGAQIMRLLGDELLEIDLCRKIDFNVCHSGTRSVYIF